MSHHWGRICTIAICLFAFSHAHAQDDTKSSSPHYDHFYTIPEQTVSSMTNQTSSLDPAQTVREFLATTPLLTELRAQVYNLLNFQDHQGSYGNTATPYNRVRDFGTWIRDPSGQTCYNTRARVLIRDSKAAVDFTSSHCTVRTGVWEEPYTGQEVTQASALQIDHVVPLKNAYISGAASWDYQKRCLYANFMGNDFHLLTTDGRENMRKGDSGPEGYIPPNDAFKCTYLKDWVRIKMIWQLELNPDEVQAIQKAVADNNCDPQDFVYSVADLQAQRQFMQANATICKSH